MIIVQISDTHIDPESPHAEERVSALARCIDDINRLDPRPDVVIHTGDLVHNGDAEKYRIAADILAALKPPLHVAAGNRDDRAAIRSTFAAGRDLMPGTRFAQYSVDGYPVRLIALDTLSEVSNMGEFCDIRADSLRAALAEDDAKPTVLFMHHPPFEVVESKYRWQYDSQDGIVRMREALAGQHQVVGAFCGHAHRLSAGTIAAVPVSTTPSVAIDVRLGDFPDEARAAPLYRIHRFNGRFNGRAGFSSELRIAR